MWVKFKKTFQEHGYLFPAGHKKDLPAAILDKISEDYYEATPAPWDELKDPRVARLAELKDNVTRARRRAGELKNAADQASAEADGLVHGATQKQDAAGEADTRAAEAVEQAKEEGATIDDERYADQCVRIAERLSLESDRDSAELHLALAKYSLLRMDAEDAERTAIAAEAELKPLTDEIDAEKARAKEDARLRAEAEKDQADKDRIESEAEAGRNKAAEEKARRDYVKSLSATHGQMAEGNDVTDEQRPEESRPADRPRRSGQGRNRRSQKGSK